MSYLRLAGWIGLIVAVGLAIWLFYARIIKNQATTYQKASEMQNYSYHYDWHPMIGFGCQRIPAENERLEISKKEVKK